MGVVHLELISEMSSWRNNNFDCNKCASQVNLTKHKFSEHGVSDFYCKNCDRPYANKKSFSSHITKLHKNSDGMKASFKKEKISPPEYKQDENMGDVIKSNHEKTTTFDCKNCKMKFHEDYLLKMHISQFHNENLIYKCDKCDKVFASHSSRTKHFKRLHTSNETWTIECKDCMTKYPDQATLNSHLSTKIHTKEEDLKSKCKLCNKAFKMRIHLKNHLLSGTHKNDNIPEVDSKEFHNLLYS